MYLQAVDDAYTLERFRSRRKFAAADGGAGGTNLRTGAHGEDLVIDVPAGTAVFDDTTGDPIADLAEPGMRELVAHGGRGGWG